MKKDVKVLALDLELLVVELSLVVLMVKNFFKRNNNRFTNDPVILLDTMYWDVLRLFHDIKNWFD